MSKYLFLFTIGPVQNFIAQARKTQDLFGGSQILSNLIEDVLDGLNNEKVKFINYPVDIIFPNKEKELKSCPNRFTMIVTTNKIDQVGENLKNYVKDRFKEYSKETFKLNINDSNIQTDFFNQIDDFLEVYWVAVPLKESNENYYNTYKDIEAYMGAVKNVKIFDQLEEKGRKCSLCGCRNALVTNWKSNKKAGLKNNKGFNEQNAVYLKNNKVKKQEGLCAVCFTKRFFNFNNNSFDSLAKIAVLDALEKVNKDPEGKQLIDEYKKCFNKGDFDEELLFKENVTKEYFEKCSLDFSEKINNIYSNFYSYCKDKNIKFNKYFSAIAFDGDSMGKWLSGEKIKDPQNNLKIFHKELSKKLMEFAKDAKDYVDKQCGITIYAGGEDFLGLINLEKLFDTMKYLRNEFNEMVNEPLKQYYIDENCDITFSAGIVVTHYKVPFSETLKWTRIMEHKAKETFEDNDKDAFSISLLRRSGEISEAVFKWKKEKGWNHNCEFQWTTENLKNIVESVKNGKFSYTFLINLMKEFRLFDSSEKIHDEIIKCEIGRLIRRSCKLEKVEKQNEKNFLEEKNEQINALIKNVLSLYEDMDISGTMQVPNFLSMLSIIDFISREVSYEN
ncbi:type III-B CRISPR-associated protein Cas10/Cmr2 [Clostridium sp. ZBS14]|uniref:type III-B CRISPR-associated protein Cas10/Cmr2 n=1 Tax=Clostridium sp. ZBS14 TaxID=2949970 RepID=UPI00207A804A|nr:type III-B CRISPR-associated protein Cas10/Cmr2 [Clostridium sp. ZBS14]